MSRDAGDAGRRAVLVPITRHRGDRAITIGYALDCRACGFEYAYLLTAFGSTAQLAAAAAVRRHNLQRHADVSLFPDDAA